MLTLVEQYEVEAKKIDEVICQKLKEALEVGFEEDVNGLEDKDLEQLQSKLNTRKKQIISLFDGSFLQNQNIVRNQMEREKTSTQKPGIDEYSQLANKIIREKVDTVLDGFVGAANCSVMEAGVGIDRKTFIDEVLDRNIQVDLKRDKERTESEDYGDR